MSISCCWYLRYICHKAISRRHMSISCCWYLRYICHKAISRRHMSISCCWYLRYICHKAISRRHMSISCCWYLRYICHKAISRRHMDHTKKSGPCLYRGYSSTYVTGTIVLSTNMKFNNVFIFFENNPAGKELVYFIDIAKYIYDSTLLLEGSVCSYK